MYDWTKDDRGWFKGNFAENFAVDIAKLSYPDAPEYDPTDYESMKYWSQVKGVSSYANAHMVELEKAELERWKDDFKKYTGADYDPAYPIRSNAYSRQYAFSPSQGLMDMYSNLAMLRRW